MGKGKSKQTGGVGAPAEVLLHRDLSTNTQLGMLLSVVNATGQILFTSNTEAETIPGNRLVPGEARLAAENTFMKACECIDSILDDARRWGVEYQLTLETQYAERHAEQLTFIKAQQAAEEQRKATAAEIITPHFRYKPLLVKIEEDGKWLAYLGDPQNLDTGILGYGDNPQEALVSFDAAFAGNLSPAVIGWLKQRETNLDNGNMAMPPFPKEQENETETVDERRPGETQDPASGGEMPGGDSSVDEPDEDGAGA